MTDMQLVLGNCLDVLPTLEAGCVNIIITSPPYNVGLKYATYNDNLPQEEFDKFNHVWLAEMFRVMADGGRAYVVVSDRMTFSLKPMAEQVGFKFAQLLTWCKPNLSGGRGRITGDWNRLTEQILLFRKGKRTPMLRGKSNTHPYFVIPSPQSNWKKEEKVHPAQFPIELPKRLLSRTPGGVVLDPFMGSGSVGVAALQMGRSFIGIEMDPGYFDIAKRRIAEEHNKLTLNVFEEYR